MEMGKLTAKLRDAVPVCLLVEGKEIKRYKNIEIPDELKKLEYQDFKFDVPLNGAITFKIMFAPGVLPEEFPQTRERRTRKPLDPEAQPQATAAADEAEDAAPQDAQLAEAIPTKTVKALVQALEDAQAAGTPVDALAEAVANGETIKTKIIGDATCRVLVITAEPEKTETTAQLEITDGTAQPENHITTMKPVPKGKGKKGTAPVDSADK